MDESPSSISSSIWRKIKSLLPVELLLAVIAAVAVFAHYDEKAAGQEKAIEEIRSDEHDRDTRLEATRLEIKRDQDAIHNELKDDWKSLAGRLEKISDDIEAIKMTQLKLCLSNKIKCQ